MGGTLVDRPDEHSSVQPLARGGAGDRGALDARSGCHESALASFSDVFEPYPQISLLKTAHQLHATIVF